MTRLKTDRISALLYAMLSGTSRTEGTGQSTSNFSFQPTARSEAPHICSWEGRDGRHSPTQTQGQRTSRMPFPAGEAGATCPLLATSTIASAQRRRQTHQPCGPALPSLLQKPLLILLSCSLGRRGRSKAIPLHFTAFQLGSLPLLPLQNTVSATD